MISDFWQFRHPNSAELSLVLRKFKFHQENWHGRGIPFNEPVQHKNWRAYRVTAKKQSKREQTYHVCLHATEKYEKVESVNTQNDYETASKNWTDKKETDLLAQVTLPDS